MRKNDNPEPDMKFSDILKGKHSKQSSQSCLFNHVHRAPERDARTRSSSDGGQDAVLPPPELQDPTIVEPQVLLSVPNYSEPSVGTGWMIE